MFPLAVASRLQTTLGLNNSISTFHNLYCLKLLKPAIEPSIYLRAGHQVQAFQEIFSTIMWDFQPPSINVLPSSISWPVYISSMLLTDIKTHTTPSLLGPKRSRAASNRSLKQDLLL